MKTKDTYFDMQGHPVSLDTLCRKEPEWAANIIRRYAPVYKAACNYVSGMGACNFSDESEDGLCSDDNCDYCDLARSLGVKK